jgi:putative aldouronate transport system permease protein
MKPSAGTYAVKRRHRYDIWDVLIHLVLIAASLVCTLPFIHVVAKSLSEDAFVVANKVYLWPAGFTLGAYEKIFADDSILRSLYISVLVTVVYTIVGMIITICAAYPLSRRQLKGRTVLTFFFIFTMYFHGGMIPDYMLMNNLGMLDTLWSLILPLSFSAFNLLIMKSSIMSSIPASLEESARIDGAGHFKFYGILFSRCASRFWLPCLCIMLSGAGMRMGMPSFT